MKIALLSDRIPPENIGGAGRVAWSLALGMRDAGHEVHVIAGTSGKTFSERRDGIQTYHLHSHIPERFLHWINLYNPQTVGPLRVLLKQIQPDVVNAHNVHHDLSYAGFSVAHQLKLPVVFTAHDLMTIAYGKVTHFIDPAQPAIPVAFDTRLPVGYNLRQMRFRYNPFRNLIIRRILNRTVTRRVSVSEAQRQALAANGLTGFRVVYNGVDPAAFDLPQAEIDAYRARLEGRPTVLFAGRLSVEKGSTLLIKAFAQVIKRVPAARLHVLAPQPKAVTQLFAGHGVPSENIQFGGWLNGKELIAAFRAVDVIVVPSIFLESFPMVALEGMAAAKPLVVSCFGGLPETTLNGETGYIVNPFDTETLADRLVTLFLEPERARQMGAAGRRRLVERFTLARQVQGMEAVYREAIQAAR